MNQKRRIVCVHLLNDFSGSPNVLRTMINVLLEEGYEIDLIVNKQTEGFLTGLNVNYKYVSYNFSKNIIKTFIYLFWFQTQVFFKALSYSKKECLFFINTTYPFSAAIAGKIINKKVIYYIHESRQSASFLKNIFFKFSEYFSDCNIFVSDFIKNEDKSSVLKKTIYNTLDKSFIDLKKTKETKIEGSFNVIFLGSLKIFKGIYTFVELARRMKKTSEIQFFMMLNGSQENIDSFVEEFNDIDNLHFMDNKQYSVHDIYNKGDILLNLSISKYWIETFGLTILEGFEYGLPAIVPNIGGPKEIVDDSINGFCVDTENIELIVSKIKYLYDDPEEYIQFKQEAIRKGQQFCYENYKKKILTLVEEI